MFLAWTLCLCSEELLLLESVREEKVQALSQMRGKGFVEMVVMGVRTQRIAFLSGGKEQLV